MDVNTPIMVAGARGMVGSAVIRRLEAAGYRRLLSPVSGELDLRDQAAVTAWFAAHRPAYVFLAAARVGGIVANDTYPADFLRDNLQIQTNVIDAAYRSGTTKLLFFGTSCIYPKLCPQPMREDHLLTGPLEPTNQWYAIAKIAGIKMCQAYRRQYGFNAISLMPTSLYGIGDSFHLETAHVIPALMRKFHEAKVTGAPSVPVWGTGAARREFLHVDDLADAALHMMRTYDGEEIVNIGVGADVSIRDLAELIRRVVDAPVEIHWDTSKPEGTPRKLMDVSRQTALGWAPRIALQDGLASTYGWFRANIGAVREG